MTAAAAENTSQEESHQRNLPAEARALAETHLDLKRAEATVADLFEMSPFPRALERARRHIASTPRTDGALDKAGEWYLDNYYFIRRVARQVAQELPRGFLRHLPRLAFGPRAGLPRIEALARALVARGIELDVNALARFIESYQETSALSIAELWALPTMLRAAALRALLDSLIEMDVPVSRRTKPGRRSTSNDCSPTADRASELGGGVERSIRALRFLSEVDWKLFFEKSSRVEAILRKEPGHIYGRMDFDTCDSYRKAVEDLAWATEATEEHVAELAVALADGPADSQVRHVGYYLVGEGRGALEKRLGYRPHGLERTRRTIVRWPTLAYLAALGILTVIPLLVEAEWLRREGTRPVSLLLALLVTIIPASVVAITFVHWSFARLLSPRTLPKLDFSKGLPVDTRTLIVIPTLLGRPEDVEKMVRQIELHYLANPDPGLQFALLTDHIDSRTPSENTALLEAAMRGITALNAKHGKDTWGPFHLLHRSPKWNAAEGRFMGWERKRGKLLELNRLLRGDKETSYTLHVGDPKKLESTRFVITLDIDTQLPMGSASRLVGLFAHPLNRAVFDDRTGRVTSGYTIVQPRVETSPSSVRETRFAQVFSGDVGYDIYTHACSDLYQDLFGAGIYVGKGIYDVDAFMRSVDGRVPENAIASHDLFEGVHGRTALATDIVLFEGYPSHYAAYARRMHRWVRGDWQLVPWLLPRVPSAQGGWIPNPLPPIDRWKIVDNLRRSLTSPLFFLLLVFGWTWLPGRPLFWTIGTLALFVTPALPSLASRRGRAESLERCAFAIAFLAHETSVVVDAVVRVAVRTLITKRHLLEWTSAAHSAAGLGARSPRALLWGEMVSSPLLAVAAAAAVAMTRPSAFVAAAPLLALWFVAPEIARWVSEPSPPLDLSLPADARRKLRRLARRTWLFFEAFVGPNDQWLPIDNYQEQPHQQTAHRTSPTNIGMLLLSTLSAYDLGYLGATELALRLRRSFESIARLVHYQGHLLNWYETKSLEPLLPKYVSTVDSGNFAGSLLALKQACSTVGRGLVPRAVDWEGASDLVELLEEAISSLPLASTRTLRGVIARMRDALDRGRRTPDDAYDAICELGDRLSSDLDRELFALIETGVYRNETERLRSLRMAIEHLHQQLQEMRRELDTLLPWLRLKSDARACEVSLPTGLRLDEIAGAARSITGQLDRWEQRRRSEGSLVPARVTAAARLRQAAGDAASHASALCNEFSELADRADHEVSGMDFRLLFDGDRRLFRIGYNVTVDRVDANYYDLLASEARLASYLAIVKRDVPEAHWYALGRPMTRAHGGSALLSWGGTMFEYLMPSLLMRSREGTLLHQTCAHVVSAQIAYGKENEAPWGVSESAYAKVDAHETYQYRSFGVPGLGFKRGLEDDLVVAPYASLLALSIQPSAVVKNLTTLESMQMLGPYGMFEAVDLQRDRALEGQPFAVVRSYMAHHQGMLLVAINNYLNDEIMVDRFHSDPMVETGEMLLNERPPVAAPPEWPKGETAEVVAAAPSSSHANVPAPWSLAPDAETQAFVVSNGRLTSLLTAGGGGGLLWQGLALTRYQPDPSREDGGLWIYVRDEESGHLWRATSNQARTTYGLHKAEFHRRQNGISIHVDVTVAPADDVEVRQVTIRNETNQRRQLTLTTVGEPALLPARDVGVHPAFSKMFVESEWDADLEGVVFSRRPRSEDDAHVVVAHRLVREGPRVKLVGYETDRTAFYGRSRNARAPEALAAARGPLRGRVGSVLDPLMSLMAKVELKPNGIETLAFITTAGPSRGAAVELARRYGSMHAVRWTFRDATQWGSRQLQRAELAPELLPAVQRLYSSLLFAQRSLRAPSSVITAGHPCKRQLWGKGISGDDPILLVRVDDAEAPLVREVIAAQRYLRACGVRLELVFVDQKASGYVNEGAGALRNILVQCGVDEWINRHGGIFVIVADQLAPEDRLLLEASARVVLDTTDGSLAARAAKPWANPPDLPRLEPTLIADPSPGVPVVPELLFGNGTGGFSKDGREYVIVVRTDQPTPAPWCNVLANPEFGCLVSESSLGCTWSGNSGENRLTAWRNDPVLDTPSETLYLRDEESAAVWSPTPLPAGRDAATVVRHGAGYTTYVRESHGLTQELTIFVPHDASLKVARLRLKNTRDRHRRLTATYYAEWVLGSQREEQRPYVTSELDRANACLLARCTWNADFGERVAFLASDRSAHGFTTDRGEFLGRRGDYATPEALERWGLSGRVDAGVDPCAALQVHLELKPGEEIETHFILGQAQDRDAALALVLRFRDPAAVETAWNGLNEFWNDVLGRVRVKTPEPAMDLLLNRWLLYQTLSARFFGRTGFYQSSGAFGFRDQLQDVLALLHTAPDRTRAHILEAAAHQFEEGDVLHWWHPPEGRGVRTRCSDDMAWLPFATAEYVNATGDRSILSERVPFLKGEPLRADEHDRYAKFDPARTPASLFEHCRRALERASTTGRHGLPLMGDGDWNDGMNRVGAKGVGESVWLGWFLATTMKRFAPLCASMNDEAGADRWRERASSLHKAIADHAWDGGWYVRAFHDDGSLIGSARERECRIDSIAQSWAAISGDSDETRTRLALQSVDERLVRDAERLVLLLTPPFDITRHDPGYIRAYPPGVRENGAQYTHAATWLGWAYAELGDGERAERIFRLLSPVLRTRTEEEVDRYRIEPYVLAGDIYSVPPFMGRGGWSWYTGAAAWMWRLGVESILGLQMDHGELKINPCIPPSWTEFEAWLRIGTKELHVVVENPDAVSKGIATVTVDGVTVASNRIGIDSSESNRKGPREVRVRLGARRSAVRNTVDEAPTATDRVSASRCQE